jgi:AraC-like DNA-binding protein
MKHQATPDIEYRPVEAVDGLETLSAHKLRHQFDRHFHDTYSFGIVIEGVERCHLHRAEHLFEPGTVPLFNPGEVHDGGPATESGWSYRMVYLDPSLVEDQRIFPSAARRDPLACCRVGCLFEAIDHGTPLGVEECLRLALDTLLEREQEARIRSAPSSIRRVRERIDMDCCEALRLQDLCAIAEVSPTRLLRAFEATYGLTPHRYQQSRRIAKAKRMVTDGNPLAEIASACGYADQSHLNRWFLRICGTTPGRYRRNFLQD